MNNRAISIKKGAQVFSDETGSSYDLGAYSKLQLHLRVKVASNAAKSIQFEHAATDDDLAYMNVGDSMTLAGTGNFFVTVSDFLRYVRFKASSGITTVPTVSLFVIAKEN